MSKADVQVSRPNHYVDAGVYSMTEDQLDDIISEIVLETGFQGMVRPPLYLVGEADDSVNVYGVLWTLDF